MLSVLLGLHFALTLAIIGLILLQKHDSDGALGSSGGGAASGMFSVRGQANILTKSTAILMTIFMVNCLVMAKITKNKPSKVSVIDRVANESILPVKDDPKDSSVNSETASNEKPAPASSSNSNQPKTSKQPTPAKPASKDSTKK
ncbi:MAG: preprotein translocase subunit SecG [Alphaproteobacteria bacterium]|nr:preprotein translocase subunit SecG [Alphaproteobacteria bacterium]MCR4555303.1 preprotein translocase subunit SecG [Alphaproteobacteria bacterium]